MEAILVASETSMDAGTYVSYLVSYLQSMFFYQFLISSFIADLLADKCFVQRYAFFDSIFSF